MCVSEFLWVSALIPIHESAAICVRKDTAGINGLLSVAVKTVPLLLSCSLNCIFGGPIIDNSDLLGFFYISVCLCHCILSPSPTESDGAGQ